MIDTIINHIQLNGLTGFLSGYLFGSIPFGLVLCLLAGYGDIRKIGSGNIGATNVLRTGNKPLAAATLILDSSKGAIAVLLAAYFFDKHAMFGAALGAVLGHNFPIWLKFKGGKGVATTLGTFLALSWPVGLACCAAWLVSALISRISSLSALIALALAPIFAVTIGDPKQLHLIGVIALLGWIRHKDNISRLLAGTEPKIGKKKDDAA
ncbi:MAG: acyl-phosphate glycerol 3-phosphate acyltransferase [Micavibrio aeruginosavorus]|uniref:Glycerol-3-phosphate acyltransferase n=1 Tax=Micavibrio aeruginosavorus TaxID=349221 RepID=A0A2W5FPV6_9BACT|nr:MAG: acyl-phosphate glycerol 3-phosphate acyltransferase [Micavibrio aeruginosavorus]